MTEPTSAAPETEAPSTAQPTAEEFKERFPGVETVEETKSDIPTTRLHLCSDGKHRNDEQYEVYKQYEERLELKKAQFKKDPDRFVHEDDIIMAVIEGDKGRGCVFGRYPLEVCKASLVTLQIQFFTAVQEMNYKIAAKTAEEKEKGLVGADGKPIDKKPGIIT